MGGLLTALFSSILQCAAMSGFLFTSDTAGLFAVATAFGLGFILGPGIGGALSSVSN